MTTTSNRFTDGCRGALESQGEIVDILDSISPEIRRQAEQSKWWVFAEIIERMLKDADANDPTPLQVKVILNAQTRLGSKFEKCYDRAVTMARWNDGSYADTRKFFQDLYGEFLSLAIKDAGTAGGDTTVKMNVHTVAEVEAAYEECFQTIQVLNQHIEKGVNSLKAANSLEEISSISQDLLAAVQTSRRWMSETR